MKSMKGSQWKAGVTENQHSRKKKTVRETITQVSSVTLKAKLKNRREKRRIGQVLEAIKGY